MIWTRKTQWPYSWHRWFAWYPVQVADLVDEEVGIRETRYAWWSWIETRAVVTWAGSYNEYRPLQAKEKE